MVRGNVGVNGDWWLENEEIGKCSGMKQWDCGKW